MCEILKISENVLGEISHFIDILYLENINQKVFREGVDKRGPGMCRATWYVGTCRDVNPKMVKIYYTKRSNCTMVCSELWYVHVPIAMVCARTYSYGMCTYHGLF